MKRKLSKAEYMNEKARDGYIKKGTRALMGKNSIQFERIDTTPSMDM
ncbi:hypothetical protein GCM10020331_087590 [Ectobacillus funiculus]